MAICAGVTCHSDHVQVVRPRAAMIPVNPAGSHKHLRQAVTLKFMVLSRPVQLLYPLSMAARTGLVIGNWATDNPQFPVVSYLSMGHSRGAANHLSVGQPALPWPRPFPPRADRTRACPAGIRGTGMPDLLARRPRAAGEARRWAGMTAVRRPESGVANDLGGDGVLPAQARRPCL
jgi:hypothetical protein